MKKIAAVAAMFLAAACGPEPETYEAPEPIPDLEIGYHELAPAIMSGDYGANVLDGETSSTARRTVTEERDSIYFDFDGPDGEWSMVSVSSTDRLETMLPKPGQTVILASPAMVDEASSIVCSTSMDTTYDGSARSIVVRGLDEPYVYEMESATASAVARVVFRLR